MCRTKPRDAIGSQEKFVVDRQTLELVFIWGPIIFMASYSIINKLAGWDAKYFRQDISRTRYRRFVYIGKSRVVGALFKLGTALMVLSVISVFVYTLVFSTWVGK